MELAIARLMLGARSGVAELVHRAARSERGEGVISAAIAVLIMAFIGAAMWLAFNTLFDNAATKTAEQVDKIGG